MIVTIDTDLQDPPELVREMLHKVEDGYDVVHAQRNRRTGESWFKLTSAKVFYRLLDWFSIITIIEDCGDFRAFTRPVQETLSALRLNVRDQACSGGTGTLSRSSVSFRVQGFCR